MMVDDKPKSKKEKQELKKGEKWCDGCNAVVKSRNFNHYFGVCHDCEENLGNR